MNSENKVGSYQKVKLNIPKRSTFIQHDLLYSACRIELIFLFCTTDIFYIVLFSGDANFMNCLLLLSSISMLHSSL